MTVIVGWEAMLKTAKAEIGYTTKSSGWTKYGQWYGDRHHDSSFATADFCDAGVSWCGFESGNHEAVGEFAYCENHVDWFKGRNQWGHTPKVGALVFFDWPNTPVGANHVGLVIKVDKDGTIHTIEWNHARQVEEVHRTIKSEFYGFGYPAYFTPPPPVADDVAVVVSLGA